jgi:DNA modification methylase
MNDEHQPELIPQTNSTETPEEQAKRDEYRRRLAEYLKDPTFRATEGFPIGTDEDILALSDPPYYTACPNPFLPEIIEQWQQEREEIRQKLGLKEEKYQREPFAADVSEGKNDPIYNAHSYHTKVPHKAIMRYILHYTDPGDIVFDGFCGTGMTGVAAQLCGDKKTVESLGYRVDKNGVVWEGEKAISRLGARKAVLNDLSPAATFISYNYNTPVDAAAFEREAKKILKEVEQECGWMYETWHPSCDDPHRVKARINYTVWSEVSICPNCLEEIVFSDEALDKESGHVRDEFPCPTCGVILKKDQIELQFETHLNPVTKEVSKSPKRKPVIINYQYGKNRFEKRPDSSDFEVIGKIDSLKMPDEIPPLKLPDMQMVRVGRMKTTGVTYISNFFLPRQAQGLAGLWKRAEHNTNPRMRTFLFFFIEQAIWGMSILSRYVPTHYSQVNQYLSGVFYVASHISEVSPWYNLDGKLGRLVKAFQKQSSSHALSAISTENLGSIQTRDNFIDYVFTDPPFGENIYYSDLNILIEAWHKVRTAPESEAIVDRVKGKDFHNYESSMQACFDTYYHALKPGRWITIEFHNSQNSIWNAIQNALQKAGFIIADVRTLDKVQGSFQQITSSSAVKQDLIISAYKPNGNLEDKFRLKAGTEDGVWDFVRYHLGKVPVINLHHGEFAVNSERQAYLLFDRMVAFHIQRGVMVPLSAPEFYAGLEQHFTRRDGMYYLPDQVAEYDRAMLNAKKLVQLTLFVNDEKTAITWLRQQLDPTSGGEPKTQGDLTNDFNRVMNRAKHEQPLELIEILKQNFLQDTEGKWYVPDHNKASDLEKVRQRTLLKEFKEYNESTGRLRVFRSEAVRAGFADCFKRQDYETIVTVAERLPEDVLREDPDLLMYYDSALLRKK